MSSSHDTESLDLDLTIDTLGEPAKPSPLKLSTEMDDLIANFTSPDERLLHDALVGGCDGSPSFELAGPRQLNYFDGADVTAGIVTCGGLCPGLNNVIRTVVHTLWHHYCVRRIYGFRYGYRGLAPFTPDPPLVLTPKEVSTIHGRGGTMLGSSRGPQAPDAMVDTLQRLDINTLFIVGGDGGMRGALAIYEEVKRRGLPLSVIGVPKTIDNDLPYIEKTFGYETAVSIAKEAISAAHVEALGAPNGLGLVRLMGRHSGFIAAAATLASGEVNLVLVPEIPFDLEGAHGLYEWLRRRLKERGHAVIVVAEGAGQRHLETVAATDASGNVKLGDIGVFLRDRIKAKFKEQGDEITLKYIDPSYIIRAAPANASDAIFCGRLAEDAVHAAMAGKTGMVVGRWMSRFTHVPLSAVTRDRKRISPDSQFWRAVVDSTGQPATLC